MTEHACASALLSAASQIFDHVQRAMTVRQLLVLAADVSCQQHG
jgi:hypothetical protein